MAMGMHPTTSRMSLRNHVAGLLSALLERAPFLFVGTIALASGAGFLYWGAHGFLGYRAGVREAWTEPWVCLLGIVGGGWMLVMSIRLFRGAGKYRQRLLSPNQLFILSVGCIIGAIWAWGFAGSQVLGFLFIGISGLVRWWSSD